MKSIFFIILAGGIALTAGWFLAPEGMRREVSSFAQDIIGGANIDDAVKKAAVQANPKERRKIIIQELKANLQGLEYRLAVESGTITEEELEEFLLEAGDEERAEEIMATVRSASAEELIARTAHLARELEDLNEKDAIIYEIAEKAIDGISDNEKIDCAAMCADNRQPTTDN